MTRRAWGRPGRRWPPLLLLPATVALLFAPLLSGREILWGDFVSWYFPSHEYAAERIAHLELPLWNPYTDSGMPFMGEADHGTLYPPSLPLHLLGWNRRVLFEALQAFALLHLVWGGLALYLVARRLGCSRWASVAGGLAFSLSGTFVARAAHLSLVCAQAWLPVAFGGLHFAIARRSRRALVLCAVAIAMIGLSGSPATVVVAVVGLGAIALGNAGAAASARALALARGLLAAALAAGAGLLVASAQLLPMLELVENSERSLFGYPQISQYALSPESLVLLIWPRFYGWLRYDALSYWGPENFSELACYAGWLPLCVLPLALGRRVRRRALPWLTLAVTGLWLALGASGGVHRLFYEWVPVLGSMRAPGRFLVLWACGLGVLTAIGTDAFAERLRRGGAGARLVTGLPLAALAGAALVVALLAPILPGLLVDWQRPFFLEGVWRALLAIALTIAGVAAAARLRPAARTLCLALALDLVVQWWGVGLNPSADLARSVLAPQRSLAPSWRDPTLHRVDAHFGNPGGLLLARVQVDSGPGRHLLDYQRYREHLTSRDSPLYDLLGIGYLVESVSADVLAPGPNLVAPAGLWLTGGAATEIAVRPPRSASGLELLLTVDAGDRLAGEAVGQIELITANGPLTIPLRLGIESGDLEGKVPPTAAVPARVRQYVHVQDAGVLTRSYYRVGVGFERRELAAVRLRHLGGGSALVVKELRLVGDATGTPWQRLGTVPGPRPFFDRTFRNTDAAPRAWLARRHVHVASPEAALDELRFGRIDPRMDVTIEGPCTPRAHPTPIPEPVDGVPPPPAPAAASRAEVTAYAPERIDVDVTAPSPGAWLVLGEVTYPGWEAAVDGAAAPVARADGLFRAVWVEAGAHRVVFRYRPRSFAVGTSLSGATVVALLSLWLRRRAAQERLEPASSEDLA